MVAFLYQGFLELGMQLGGRVTQHLVHQLTAPHTTITITITTAMAAIPTVLATAGNH